MLFSRWVSFYLTHQRYISSWFRSSSKDVLSDFSIFDPMKVSSLSTHQSPLYGDRSIQTLIEHFGRDLPAKSLEGTEFGIERVCIGNITWLMCGDVTRLRVCVVVTSQGVLETISSTAESRDCSTLPKVEGLQQCGNFPPLPNHCNNR